MSKFRGFIPLNRAAIFEHPLYSESRFDEFRAFIDILLLAAHTRCSYRKKGIDIVLERGEVGRSIIELGERWGWNPKSVTAFLQRLVKNGEITKRPFPQGNPLTTIIRLLNYEYFVGISPLRDTIDAKELDSRTDNEKESELTSELDTSNNDEELSRMINELEEDSDSRRGTAATSPLAGLQSNEFSEPLSQRDFLLAQEIVLWMYDSGSFRIDKPQEEMQKMVENSIRKYGFKAIQQAYDDSATEGGWNWPDNLYSKSGLVEFWRRVQELKARK